MMMSKVKHSWLMPLMAVAILLGGCVADEGTCPPEGTAKPLTLTLNVKVPVSSVPGTRSEANDHKPEAATDAENYISFGEGDYKLIVFDKDGNFLTDDIKMQKASAGATSPDGLYTIHTLVGEIPNPIEKGDNKKEKLTTFSLMLLANTEAFTPAGTSYDFTGTSIAGGNPDNIFTDETNFNFTVPHKTDATTTTSWTPAESKRGIPMFGLVNLNLKTNGEWNGDKTGTTLNMVADMPVLRSLAKIEIVDMVPGKSADIERVVLTKYNTTGRLIPDITAAAGNDKWDQLKTQVSSPSLPDDVNLGTSLTFAKESRNVVIGDNPRVEQLKDVFVAYVPEMELTGTVRPVLEVYLENVEEPYKIELSVYKDGKPQTDGAYASLLRNHLYRFNVKNVGMDAVLTIETYDWDVDDDQFWDYEDAEPKFDAPFTWKDYAGNPWGTSESAGEFDASDIKDMYRILLIGSSAETAAYGSFKLSTPAANNPGTWTIALMSDDDTNNDHFKIEVKNSDEEWVSQGQGDSYTAAIGDDPVDFRIMATGVNGSSTDYTARIVMAVKTFDGRLVNIALRSKYDPYITITDSNDPKFYFVVKQRTNGGDNM